MFMGKKVGLCTLRECTQNIYSCFRLTLMYDNLVGHHSIPYPVTTKNAMVIQRWQTLQTLCFCNFVTEI